MARCCPSANSRWRWYIALLLACCLLIGCGTPQQRYRVLSFFFDGVPDPDAPKADAGNVRVGRTGEPIYLHQPYAQKQCDSCHPVTEDIFVRVRIPKDACRKCHAGIPMQYAKMHGPVASDECLLCHSSHQSTFPHLLKQPAPKVCTQCHELPTLSQQTPEHRDPKADCLTCHSGHGGSDRTFMKVTQAGPATQPAGKDAAPR